MKKTIGVFRKTHYQFTRSKSFRICVSVWNESFISNNYYKREVPKNRELCVCVCIMWKICAALPLVDLSSLFILSYPFVPWVYFFIFYPQYSLFFILCPISCNLIIPIRCRETTSTPQLLCDSYPMLPSPSGTSFIRRTEYLLRFFAHLTKFHVMSINLYENHIHEVAYCRLHFFKTI